MIYIHLAQGFEEIEAITIADILRRAELDTKLVSISPDKIVVGAHGIPIVADILYDEGDYSTCEMIVLPGGGPGSKNLDNHSGTVNRLTEFANEGKWIAAICAAPMVFAHHDLITGKKATIFKGMEDELKGSEYVDSPVVVDGKVITSQGPGTAMDFALEIVKVFRGDEVSDKIRTGLLLPQ